MKISTPVVLCARAKNHRTFFVTLISMKNILDESWTADEVMKTYPNTVYVFLALKTDCVGCALARFCTIEQVAAAYKLPLESFLERLGDSEPIVREE
jgi:hybrid cluster-associated redox disulfide protein